MYMDDPFIWSHHVHRTGRVRRGGAGRLRRGGKGRRAPNAPVRGPYRRQLAAMERTLIADAPALASKFSVFNQLTDGERPVGAELVPGPRWPRLRAAHLAVLLILTTVVAVFLTLSAQIRAPARSCPAAGASAYVPVRGLPCRAYSTAK
jgi:hypothetical protein